MIISRIMRRFSCLGVMGFVVCLSACASPPLQLYTLTDGTDAASNMPLSGSQPVLYVQRVVLPDYLDTQDILTRKAQIVARSPTGRWASRLSLSTTDLLTARLSMRYPSLLVTNEQPSLPSTARLEIHIARFEVQADQQAFLDASWSIIPHDARQPVQQARIKLHENGPVQTDSQVSALMRTLILQLADAITVL